MNGPVSGEQNKPSKLEELIGGRNYHQEIARLEDALQHQEAELKNKERAKGRIMALLESDDFEATEFRQRLALIKTEITTIEAAIQDSKEKIQTLQDAKANRDALLEFVQNNQGWLAEMREDLVNLAPEDKKLLVESLVPDKIPVWWVIPELEKAGYSGPRWGLGAFPFSFNPAIFYRLASEGKLKGLDKNGPNHPGAPWPHPVEQGQDFSRHSGHPP